MSGELATAGGRREERKERGKGGKREEKRIEGERKGGGEEERGKRGERGGEREERGGREGRERRGEGEMKEARGLKLTKGSILSPWYTLTSMSLRKDSLCVCVRHKQRQ